MARSIVAERDAVVVGVDTHGDIHVAVVFSSLGARLGSRLVATTPAGFGELVGWATGFGPVRCFGVEGTGSYGAALARHLRAVGHTVVEVDRPDRRTRRLQGKSGPVDAEAAARAVLAGTASGCPKGWRRPRGDDPLPAGGAPIGLEGQDPGEQPAPGAPALVAGETSWIAPRSVRAHRGPGGRPVPARAAGRSRSRDEARPSASRFSARRAERGDRPARPGPGAGGGGGRPGAPRPSRGGDRRRRSPAGRRGGQPRAPVQRGGLRRAVRGGTASGLLRQDQPTPAEPGRGPDRQRRALADRHGPD